MSSMVMKKIVLLSRKSFLAKIQTHIAEIEINKIQKRLEIFYKNSLSPESFAKKFENRNDNEVIACNDVESLRWL